MFKEELSLISWFFRQMASAVFIFFILPALFLVFVIGIVTGSIWKYLAIFLAIFLVLIVIEKILLMYLSKKWQKEYQKQQEEQNKVKYVIIK